MDVTRRCAFLPTALFSCLPMWSSGALAQATDWLHCPAPSSTGETLPLEEEVTRLSGDEVEAAGLRFYSAQGDVEITRRGARLQADSLTYDQDTAEVEAWGGVRYTQDGLTLEGRRGQFNLETERGIIAPGNYQWNERHARGVAARVIRESADLTIFEQATYTTCPAAGEDWILRAGKVRLNGETGRGSATNVRVSFKGVPLLYVPYISFPITDERKSGLLIPSIGYSQDAGVDFRWPLYWNIAPNYDATLTPRYMQRRGLQLGTEFRYLTAAHSGSAYAEVLRDDDIFGDTRTLVSYRHRSSLPAQWRLALDANRVSDQHYFEDLGSSLDAVSTTYLESRAELGRAWGGHSIAARVQGYQVVDPTLSEASKPYERLPQVLYQWRDAPGGDEYAANVEAVRFTRSQGVTATRIHLDPVWSLPLEGAAYALEPSARLRHTRYDLERGGGRGESRTRSVPVFSVDGTLFLERDAVFAGRSWLHTLEPRAYYLYVPFRRQDDIPVFDTSRLDFNYAQLFRHDRFSGPDRVGDANQLSIGVTSRLLASDTGAEWIRASVGQSYHFADRRVTLSPGEASESRQESDLAAELQARLGERWRADANWQWNPREARTEWIGVQLRYHDGPYRLANMGHRFRNNELDQTDFSFFWPLAAQWRAVGRWNYSYREQRPIETLAGFEYDSCCWAFRFVSRRYVRDAEGEVNQAWYFQLELKGLAGLGNGIEDLLEHGILGYRARP